MDFSSILTDGKTKNKKKSGGFQSMGLSKSVLRGVLTKGYKVPTPIQRKAIPVIMEGKNVIAMARTGSGKTAAFLIPMFVKLKCRTAIAGARGLIFSPTRELAIQTMKFTKELSRYTGLKAILVLGGERMEEQFAAIHESPDIIIATPGRFLHLVIEMDLKLSSIEYIVFDEADRLFEMGFQEQLQEVLNRLPAQRQTLLFSATLPKLLADFVRAGIEDPLVIRLDVDLQISENLKAAFMLCRTDDKIAVLLHLLKNVINLKEELTVIFAATKHHIEYLKEILFKADIPCSCIYSSLDQMARKINIAKFKTKKVCVLLVTDIAARGIDIPLLDNVINFHFPANPKLYVHRVGRVARAGRSGRAFSFIASDEIPFLLDLNLFLGKPVKFAKANMKLENDICGSVPQNIIDDEADIIQSWHKSSTELTSMQKVSKNAYQQYLKSRPAPSSESIKRIKDYPFASSEIHPVFKGVIDVEKNKFLSDMKAYRPNTTIFELGSLAKTQASTVMRKKRQYHSQVNTARLNKALLSNSEDGIENVNALTVDAVEHITLEVSETESVQKKRKVAGFKDNENYLSYMSSEHYKEKGLGLSSAFDKEAASAVLDITGDDVTTNQKLKNALHWDRKKKMFVREGNEKTVKKMKTESGVWISKSYKSDLYKKWQEKNKIKYQQKNYDSEDETESQFGKNQKHIKGRKRHMKNEQGKSGKQVKGEIKSKEEILKIRKRKSRLLFHQKQKQKARNAKSGARNAKSGARNAKSGARNVKHQGRHRK